jgi:hypothetical protein
MGEVTSRKSWVSPKNRQAGLVVYRGVKGVHPEDMVQAEGAMKRNPAKTPIGPVLSAVSIGQD